GVVDEAARDFKGVIQAGWTGVPQPTSSFSQHISANRVDQSEDHSSSSQLACNDLVVEEDTRWMDEKDYRATCKAEGYETPDNIWN
ncbi:hypothetical protein K469DRAFT_579519, partial [Zopfia rhizophila CBS 207.26]